MSQDGLLLVVSGPSGAGKSKLVEALRARVPGLGFSVSATTRPPRSGEREGVDYFFLSEGEFTDRVARGDFLEWATVYGHHYGTLNEQVDKTLRQGKDIVLDIDAWGAENVRRLRPEAVTIFVLPPSPSELRRRLEARGTDSRQTIESRLAAAGHEISAASGYQYLVINDDFSEALSILQAIIIAEKARCLRQQDKLRAFQ
ncbi:MAG: guanylate kinase [Bacillota bacterium]